MIVLAALLFLLVQSIFSPFREITLAGADPVYPKRELTSENWFSGEYQRALARKVTCTYGLRGHIVRLFNQLDFSLLGTMNPQVVKGEDDFLFEPVYQNPVCGKDLMEESTIEAKVDSLSYLDQLLREQGKKLYVMMAPNKWRYHSAKAPWTCEQASETNYDRFRALMTAKEVSTIDCIQLFEQWRDSAEYPLYAQSGTHWSIYGAWRVSQYLRDTVHADGFRMPELEAVSIDVINEPRNTDKDLHDLLNVLEKAPKTDLAYPHAVASEAPSTRAMIVADSYYWTFVYLELHDKLWAAESPFLYYNNFRYKDFYTKEVIEKGDRAKWLTDTDIVLIMLHEPALHEVGYGFLSEAIQLLEANRS